MDGIAVLGHEATDLGGGTWHYEYALYNMNMDRAIWSFWVPVPPGVGISNVGFHAPLNHPPEPHAESFSNLPWSVTLTGNGILWSTETYSTNPQANALRWGTLYNFRFDADAPPQAVDSVIGFFKSGGAARVAAVAAGGGGQRLQQQRRSR